MARILDNRVVSGPGSEKETRHIAVSIAGSGLSYKPGDSLGVLPVNQPRAVESILGGLGASGDEAVTLPKGASALSLRDALGSKLSLSGPTRRIAETLSKRVTSPSERSTLDGLLAPEAKDRLKAWLDSREFIDLLDEFPSAQLGPQEFVDHLRPLVPRLYSIASSPRVYPQEVHLTVGVVRYRTNDRERHGVCTSYLAECFTVGRTEIPVFIARSSFGLPEDASRDVIMVGPGVGIAPFRAFMQEREALKARGRNWVFFGDQRRAQDFIYEDEWTHWQRVGILTRLDTAFSRDQTEKIYVQSRMRENAAELWSWIGAGALFYVCGDAQRMAKDVDGALTEIVATCGAMTASEAAEYVKFMKKEKRYQRDIY